MATDIPLALPFRQRWRIVRAGHSFLPWTKRPHHVAHRDDEHPATWRAP
jgi:hypothetical protein